MLLPASDRSDKELILTIVEGTAMFGLKNRKNRFIAPELFYSQIHKTILLAFTRLADANIVFPTGLAIVPAFVNALSETAYVTVNVERAGERALFTQRLDDVVHQSAGDVLGTDDCQADESKYEARDEEEGLHGFVETAAVLKTPNNVCLMTPADLLFPPLYALSVLSFELTVGCEKVNKKQYTVRYVYLLPP